jgi:DNA-binding winged helix-turn-helix (wHTH) protein/TolB-like protein/Tfp pilus assembly protein PilF
MKGDEQAAFRCGDFLLVPSERLLLHLGQPLEITGKAFDLLVALVRNAGRLVSKDQLLEQVWPGLVVEEVNLSVNVSAIRKLLARSPQAADWIETVPRQGYRFIGPVEMADIATQDLMRQRGVNGLHQQAQASLQSGPRRGPSRRALAAGLLGAALGGALLLTLGYRWLMPAAPYASVAVLPFSVGAPDDAYLADGLSDGLIERLTLFRGLRVTPRASALRFKAASPDPLAAGRSLEVAAIVSASLVQAADRIKLKIELLDVARREAVWSRSYELAAAEMPQLQGRVLQDLVAALNLRPTGAESASLARPSTAHLDAYQAYLQGRFLWSQRSEPALQRAVELFRRAIDLDPAFALAYAALADAHTTLGYLGYVPPVSTFPVARPYALRALELDPSLAQAHAALAYIKFYFDWDWAGARQEFLRALELNPNDPVAHQWHAVYLLAAGQADAALREIERAHQLDPLSLAINTDIGFHHYYNGRYAEAITQLQSVLAMKSDFLLAHLWLARSYLAVGRFDDAIAATAQAESRAREWPVLITARGFTHGMAGRADEARAVLREMEALAKRRFVTAYGMALVHTSLGQKDEAFNWLDKSFDERSHWLVWLRLDPRWNALRSDPRFAALIERMKYPA